MSWYLTFLHPVPLSLTQATSDFCVAPDTFILNITEGQISTGNALSGRCCGCMGGQTVCPCLPLSALQPSNPSSTLNFKSSSCSRPFPRNCLPWELRDGEGGLAWPPRMIEISSGHL